VINDDDYVYDGGLNNAIIKSETCGENTEFVCGTQIPIKCSGRRAVGSRAPVPVRFSSGSFYSSFSRTRVTPRVSRGKEQTANSSWPIPMKWRDDGARGSPSLIWITTNCRGLWGKFHGGCTSFHLASPASSAQCIRDSAFFAERQNRKPINGPSFMFWRSFGEKVNSFGAYIRSDIPRAYVRMYVRVDVVGDSRGWRSGEKFQSPTVRPTVDAAIIFPSDPLIILRDCSLFDVPSLIV